MELAQIRAAAERLQAVVNRTPVMRSRTLDARLGASVLLKCENFQRTGAFKLRGAYNALSRLDPDKRRRGVVTFSSGNHAQAIALAGSLLGIATTAVMPSDAPRAKRAATEAYGAAVIEYDPASASREELARRLQAEQGLTLIPPFDHPDVIAGQGTAALELVDQAEGRLDMLLVPCGGGGLLSGCAVAARGLLPGCRVIGVEPALADDAARSFRSGTLQRIHHPPTLADGLRTPCLGSLTFPLIRRHVSDMLTVSEAAIVEAVRLLLLRLKIVVEPSGAVPLAALLSGAVSAQGRVGVILSGGNVDAVTLRQILAAGDA